MREVGFVNEQAHEYLWPIDIAGASPELRAELSDITDGTLARDQVDVVTSIITRMNMRGLLDDAEASAMIETTREFYLSADVQKYYRFIVTIGQKPE